MNGLFRFALALLPCGGYGQTGLFPEQKHR